MNEAGDADAQGGAHFLKHQPGGFISLPGQSVDPIGGERSLPADQSIQLRTGATGVGQLGGAPHHRRGRCIGFQATTVAAVAQAPIRPNIDVTQLGRHPLGSVPDAAIQDQSPADAGPQGEEGQLIHIPGHPHPFLSQRRGIGVVFQGKGSVHLLADPVANIETGPPRQVGSRNHQAQGELHDAGHRHANPGQSAPPDPAVPQFQDGPAHASHHIFRAFAGIRRQFQVLQQVAVFRYDAQLQIGPAQVDSDSEALHAIRPTMRRLQAEQTRRRIPRRPSPSLAGRPSPEP